LVHVDTELGAKDLLNNRMAYVAVSRGAHDAQLFTNDREKLPAALGHEVSRESAHPAAAAGEFLLGHMPIHTTERYLGSEQKIAVAINYSFGA